ncbi:S-adenosylmethionine:tRNA ribosyltransferase-isomerase [Panacibacter sp. DH6]|uniref:S-adenosylmethionine:tRNA ribosyltransferase-isomerase n=1 Tax=Panacibacter microcysteis TaxID=2793269 RepID=A0A931GY69_9BACT|nr:S-adenosylmethionine:tRNA ribosyltransferase-isomerase [Panacibacter microcysteis]
MHPKRLLIRDFLYNLPEERIARYPLPERDLSKLLVYKNGSIEQDNYYHLGKFLPTGSLLVFNNTKVVEARLLFQKQTGSTIEIFCLEPADEYADITTAMLQKGNVYWKCLVGGAKKWKEETLTKTIHAGNVQFKLQVKKVEKFSDYFLIAFSWNNSALSFAEVLHLAGAMPLPPYLNRSAEESDKERYQTIYAKHDGSVAAPTAGLHFTERLFEKLATQNIQKDFVTLHVGAGTFKPVKAESMQEHEMHTEFIEVNRSLIENILAHADSTVVAVGTTSLRTIESLYWLGLKAKLDPGIAIEHLQVYQWDAYELDWQNTTTNEALNCLLQWMDKHGVTKLVSKTQVIIAPGYGLKVAHALITNFHQPQSTLLLLVAAIIGEDWKKVYDYALQHDFRFLSYGDGCLLFPPAY